MVARVPERQVQQNAGCIIIVTTAEIEGRPVLDYLGIVSGEATMDLSRRRGRIAHLARPGKLAPAKLEQRLSEARCRAVAEMARNARELGATAILAVDLRYTSVQQPDTGDLIIVTASGTAVSV